MKKVLFIVSFLGFALSGNAQTTVQGAGSSYTLTFRKSPDFNDESILGSKYINEEFSHAKVNKGTENFLIRYNANRDVMEYKNADEIVELIKEQSTHFAFTDGTVYELINTAYGAQYHQVLSDKNNVKLSKHSSIKLEEARPASNSYDTDSPASFKRNKDVYYITINGETTEFDGKQKSVRALFPDKNSEIKDFFKNNRIRTNDEDMVKLGDFLATL